MSPPPPPRATIHPAAAKAFSGAKEGYSYKTGPQGAGYYKDSTKAGLAPGAAGGGGGGGGGAAAAQQFIYNTQLRLFKFDRATNQYKPAATTACGCVMVGAGAAYTLLIYDAQKTHLVQMPLTSGRFIP